MFADHRRRGDKEDPHSSLEELPGLGDSGAFSLQLQHQGEHRLRTGHGRPEQRDVDDQSDHCGQHRQVSRLHHQTT